MTDYVPVKDPEPEVEILSGPKSLTNIKNAIFSFSCNRRNCVTECSLDGEEWIRCDSGIEYNDLSDGDHLFRLRGLNVQGISGEVEEWSWHIDTVEPEVAIIEGPEAETYRQEARFVFSCSKDDCEYLCTLESDLSGIIESESECRSGLTFRDLEAGSYVLSVRGLDGAGNKSGTSQWSWVLDPRNDPAFDPGHPGLGGECLTQNDCFDCDGCRSRYSEICLVGECRLSGELSSSDPGAYPATASRLLYVGIPRGINPSDVRSAAIRILHSRKVNGFELSCEELLSDAEGVDENYSLNFLRVLQPALILNSSEVVVILSVNHIPAGNDRLFFVRLHTMNNAGGRILGSGCTDGITLEINSEENLAVEIIKQ